LAADATGYIDVRFNVVDADDPDAYHAIINWATVQTSYGTGVETNT